MNVKKNTLIALLLTCLMAGSTISAFADDYQPHLQVTTTNTTFSAGSKDVMSITLFNGGGYDVIEVEAILSSKTSGVTPLKGAQMVYANIEHSVSYDVDVLIDDDVAVGAYVLTLQLSYLINGYEAVDVAVPIGIVVDKPALPLAKITASSNKITPGVTNQIRLTTQNVANTSISDVEISLSSATTLVTVSDPINYRISELGPGESVAFDASVKVLENTPIGAYAVTARIWYNNGVGITSSQTLSIPLEVTETAVTRSPVVTVKNLAPHIVIPGEEFTLNLEASCAGAPVYNAKAVISQDVTGLVSPMTQTTVSLGDIPAGGNAKFSYDLLMSGSASARDIPLTVSIKYVDAKGVQGIVTETITIPVENLIKFSLMKDAVVSAEKGKTTTFEADLLLVGTGKVEFSSISVVPEGPVEKVTGSTEYIGAVDPDSPVPFTLLFKVKDNATVGDYDLHLKISYLDSRNVVQNKTISVPLQVVNPVITTTATANDGGIWGWLKRLFGIQ
ncbi:MAG: NEW3 domain-containing protein [Candidatus Bathyarchaeota archaeon]|nr:NEW3 domain-containing protein [Candidatus Bathyarchaeota archaeon]